MLQIGRYNTLVVQREVDFGFYLNPKETEVLLPRKYAPRETKPGDSLRVFVYTDSEDRPVATTLRPAAVVGEVAYLKVKDHSASGYFMDWGLEKDLLVPKSEQTARMQIGKRYVVKLLLDTRSNRVYGTTRIARHCRKAPGSMQAGQQVRLLIYQFSKRGTLAVVDDAYLGMIYHDQTHETLAIGDRRPGYINHIRADGKIDLLLKKPGYASISGSAQQVMNALQAAGGFIPCHDKSEPETIAKWFAMSKKEFKRAVGRLYKKRLVALTDRGVRIRGSDQSD